MAKYIYPEEKDLQKFVAGRYRKAWVWQTAFLSALLIAIISLTALLLNVVDGAFGYVAFEYKENPATISDKPLQELSQEELLAILQANLSKGAYNKLNEEKPMERRSQADLYNLVLERILKVDTKKTYSLYDSLFRKAEIEAEVKEEFPEASLEFRYWLTPSFLTFPHVQPG